MPFLKVKKKPTFIRNGHKCVRLNDGSKDRNEYVHRLLGKAFIACRENLEALYNKDNV